jgi:hypothetical protein
MKDKAGKGMGLLIGIGPKPKGASDEDAYEEGGDAARDLKVSAAEAMISAFKAGEADALVDALDAYMEC